MRTLSNEHASNKIPGERPVVGTTLVKRTEFGDKLVAAFASLNHQLVGQA